MGFRRLLADRRGFTLVELIISIGILAVSSLFIVQIFAQSANLAAKARDTDCAVAEAQSAIECYKAYGSFASADAAEAWSRLGYSELEERDGGAVLSVYYGENWEPVGPTAFHGGKPTAFLMTVTVSDAEDGMRSVSARVAKLEDYFLGNVERLDLTLETEVYERGAAE